MSDRVCSACGAVNAVDANWCEACGADLDAPPPRTEPCVSCGAKASEITDDGWCQLCGTKQPEPEDHVVVDHGWFAMVSDRGLVHRTNEDAGAVAERPNGVAMVVCDGVSSTDESQHASRNAATAIIDIVGASAGPIPGSANAPLLTDAIVEAANAAQAAIVDATPQGSTEPPSCTMVTMLATVGAEQAELHFGWLGDSRAYWLAGDASAQLTTDHSWAIEQHALGELDRAAIDADPRASSITRWLGADSHDTTPELGSATVTLPGTLLVCSDGLWNYAPTPAELNELVQSGPADESAVDQAKRLVSFANERGGHDNITVAIAHLTPDSPSDPSPGDNDG